MISKSRLEELEWCWENETEDEETWEWRDELNAEEQALVEQWDYGYEDGILRLCQDILELEKRREN